MVMVLGLEVSQPGWNRENAEVMFAVTGIFLGSVEVWPFTMFPQVALHGEMEEEMHCGDL